MLSRVESFREGISHKVVHFVPWFFPRNRDSIKTKIEHVFQNRWIKVTDAIGVQNISAPKLHINFEPFVKKASYYRRERTVHLSSNNIHKDAKELILSIDHEIAHHIQYEKNPSLQKNYSFSIVPSEIYWLCKGRMDRNLSITAFKEGFAAFTSSITSHKRNPAIESALGQLEKGKRFSVFLKSSLPYALGFLTFYGISKIHSENYAINVGLSETPSNWVIEGREAFAKLGIAYPI